MLRDGLAAQCTPPVPASPCHECGFQNPVFKTLLEDSEGRQAFAHHQIDDV